MNNLENYHLVASDLEKYISEVYGGKVDLTGKLFLEKEGFPAYMVRPNGLDEDFTLVQLVKHFGVGKYIYFSPVTKNIDRITEQKRPDGTYVFAHVGGGEPDTKHLGKSYNDAVEKKMIFANLIEYILMTGFHMWKHETWMDVKGWTRISSLWSDGYTVRGCFLPGSRRLFLGRDDRVDRFVFAGPRELFLG